jgi:hypothetical protein
MKIVVVGLPRTSTFVTTQLFSKLYDLTNHDNPNVPPLDRVRGSQILQTLNDTDGYVMKFLTPDFKMGFGTERTIDPHLIPWHQLDRIVFTRRSNHADVIASLGLYKILGSHNTRPPHGDTDSRMVKFKESGRKIHINVQDEVRNYLSHYQFFNQLKNEIAKYYQNSCVEVDHDYFYLPLDQAVAKFSQVLACEVTQSQLMAVSDRWGTPQTDYTAFVENYQELWETVKNQRYQL